MDGISTQLYSQYASIYNNSSAALTERLKSATDTTSDTEMLEACKEFEQYFVEQMLKEMKKTIPDDPLLSDNEYMNMFEDQMFQSVAEKITDGGQFGIAKQLYEDIQKQAGKTVS